MLQTLKLNIENLITKKSKFGRIDSRLRETAKKKVRIKIALFLNIEYYYCFCSGFD